MPAARPEASPPPASRQRSRRPSPEAAASPAGRR